MSFAAPVTPFVVGVWTLATSVTGFTGVGVGISVPPPVFGFLLMMVSFWLEMRTEITSACWRVAVA